MTLTANSAAREYTGEQQFVEGYTCDVAEASFADIALLGGKGTDAGNYPYAFAAGAVGTVSADGKYLVAKANDGKLMISANSQQIVVKIKGNTGGGKYDGTEHGIEGYTVSYVVGGAASVDAPAGFDAGDISFAGTAKATGTDAGSYPMGLKAGDFSYAGKNFSNVSFEVEDGRLDISKRALVIKPKDASRVYNGEALEASEWEVVESSPDQFLAGQGIVDPVFSGSQTAPGTSESSITGWGYQENTKADNYEILTEKGTLNVTSRGATETITVEANSTTATYDGGSHSAVGLKTTEFVVGGKAYTVSGLSTEDPSATDVGTYTNNITGAAKVTDAAGSDVTSEFDIEIKDGSLVIDPAEVTIKPKDASKPYDGMSLVASEFTATGFIGGDGVEGVSYGGSQLNFGESESTIAGFAAAGSTKLTNYRIALGKGKLEVTANVEKVVVTIRENSATFPYDGEAKTVEGYEVAKISSALYKASDFAFAGDAAHKVATGTDTGDYDMGLLAVDFENRSANFSNVVFEIEDGQLHIAAGEIDKGAVTWGVHDVQKVYDGESLSAYHARAWDRHGNELSVEYSTDGETWVSDPSKISLTHFGHLAVKLRATGANYAAGQYATGSESVAITKRLVTLESEGADKTYDGTPLTNGAVSVTPKGEGVGFVDGEGVAITVTGSQTDVGESDNTFIFSFNEGTSGDDYLVTAKCGKLKVAANAAGVVVKVVGNRGPSTYDGTEHGVEGYTVSYVVGGAASADAPAGFDAGDILFAGTAKVAGTDAGSYPMGLKADDFDYAGKNFSNVSFEVEDGELSILPATLTVTTHGASKPYDGTALTAPGEISGFVNGETATFSATGSQTLAGTSVNSYAIAWDGTAKESNYSVVEGAIGTLEVTPSQVAITVTPRDGSKVYDGKPLTSAGIDVDGLPAGFTLDAATKGAITDTGELLAEIDASTIVIRNAAGEDVTAQFANVTCGKAPLIVTRRPVTVTSATDSKVYDGAALTKHEATVTAGSLVEGESFGYDFTGEQTAVGASDNTFTVKAGANTSLDNYEITQVNGTLTVIAYTPPAPGPGTDEPTPGPGKNPSTPNGPTNSSDVTPPGSTTSDDMGSVPTASDSKETTMPKSADKATSGNNAQSEGKQSPDNASGAEQPTSCWVHWFMILGAIATLIYGVAVSLRRRRMVADLDKEIDAVLSGAKEGSGK